MSVETVWNDDDVTLLHGDAVDALRTLPDASVHACVTSPPYLGLRDYHTAHWIGGRADCTHVVETLELAKADLRDRDARRRVHSRPPKKTSTTNGPPAAAPMATGFCARGCGAWWGQLGQEATIQHFVDNLVFVFREMRRVLRDDGTLWLVLGDSYAAQRGGTHQPAETLAGGKGGKTDAGERVNRDRIDGYSPTRNASAIGLQHKDLIGIPWRVALALQVDGWVLRCDVIYSKRNPMPDSTTDRPTRSHEYIFMLSKQPKYYYDQFATLEPAVSGVAKNPGPRKRNVGGRTDGYTTPAGVNNQVTGMRNPRSVWELTTQPFEEAHFATYPEELVARCLAGATSAHGVCSVCGASWVRIVKRPTPPAAIRNRSQSTKMNFHTRQVGGGQKMQDWYDVNPARTIGWEPGCACAGATAVPATVLDCFMGSGSTAIAAISGGRRAIGIDVSREYCDMALRRLVRSGCVKLAPSRKRVSPRLAG